jgi:hypothetical protein
VSQSGGRSWWAHLTIIRMNIGPIILRNQIEEFLNVAVFSLLIDEVELHGRRSVSRGRLTLAELAELPEP